jgi:hypothetical protein
MSAEIKWGCIVPIVVILFGIAIALATRNVTPLQGPTCVEVAKNALKRGRATPAEMDFLNKCGPD